MRRVFFNVLMIESLVFSGLLHSSQTNEPTNQNVEFNGVKEPKSDKAIYVLSLNGGGIRGVILAKILESIEREMQRPINDIFDLIVGTSTGAILGSGLSLSTGIMDEKFSARSAVSTYESEGKKIFSSPNYGSCFFCIPCCSYSYSKKPLKKVFKEKFDDKTMVDCKTNIAITKRLRIFRSWEEGRGTSVKESLPCNKCCTNFFSAHYDERC